MTEPHLQDPRELYYLHEFPDQDQAAPALQSEMNPHLIVARPAMKVTTAC